MKEFTRLEAIAKTSKIIGSLNASILAYESRPNQTNSSRLKLSELRIELAYYNKILTLISPLKNEKKAYTKPDLFYN